eukprot:SAG31_NODE_166_length_21670_cov_22.507719_6_plen_210_part_00
MGTILRGAEEAAPPVAFSLPLQMEEDEADDGGSSSLALQILSQAAEESPRERFAIEPSATSAKRARDSSTGAGLGSAPQPGSPAKRQNSPRFGPTASPRLNGIASLRISPKITGVPALTSSSARLDPGAKKPRWVDVIAIAMEQLTEHTGRKSFKVRGYFLVVVQLLEKYATLIERYTALIEKVSPCIGRRGRRADRFACIGGKSATCH